MSMKNNLLKNLIQQLLKIDNAADMQDFLQGILTPKELDELPRRLEIVRQLKAGIPQHKIADNIGVGIATVTRGSREVKAGRFKVVKDTDGKK